MSPWWPLLELLSWCSIFKVTSSKLIWILGPHRWNRWMPNAQMTAPSHHLNQCWLINFTGNAQYIYLWYECDNYYVWIKLQPHLPGNNELEGFVFCFSIVPVCNESWNENRHSYSLTLKHREMHGCVVSIVATDALVPGHQYPQCWLNIHCIGPVS